METFRVAVGREHKIQPGNLVGAIANETGLGSEMIGRIKIFDRFSLVDLPQGIPAELLELLKTVIVGGRPLRISRDRLVESHQQNRKRKPGFHKSKAKQVRPRKRKK